MSFINVDVALYRDDSWLLIVRSRNEDHAAGALSLVGGTLEEKGATSDALEKTARRELLEEVGVVVNGPFTYVESTFFLSDSGEPVLNVVLMAPLGADQTPAVLAPEEVEEVLFRTAEELAADPHCPPWTRRSVAAAEALRLRAPAS